MYVAGYPKLLVKEKEGCFAEGIWTVSETNRSRTESYRSKYMLELIMRFYWLGRVTKELQAGNSEIQPVS